MSDEPTAATIEPTWLSEAPMRPMRPRRESRSGVATWHGWPS